MRSAFSHALEISELKNLARARVPRMFFDYAESGSWTGSTWNRNETDFKDIHFRQRVAVDMTNRSLATSLAGVKAAMPVALAPVGLTGMQDANGEIKAARAAAAFGIPYFLSTMSICSIEDVAAKTTEPFWFQIYMLRDRQFMKKLIDRAKAAECAGVMLTLDLQILGQRHNDIRNNMTAPPKIRLSTIIQLLSRPGWCLRMLGTRRHTFGNIVGHAQGVSNMTSLSSWTSEQFDPSLNWSDVAWVRERWPGKFIIKGIMDVEDALSCVKVGADAIIVSNHGGRQLDGAPSSIATLPSIVKALEGSGVEVHMDGGVRSGQDVLRALCLGARSVYIGRPYIYGLGSGGEAGVTKALEIIRKELDITMAMCGERDILNVGMHNLASVPKSFGAGPFGAEVIGDINRPSQKDGLLLW